MDVRQHRKRRLFLAAIALLCTAHVSQAKAPAVVWHVMNIHAGECVRLSSLESEFSFLSKGKTPKELLALLKARAPDARLQSFIAAVRADNDPGDPKPEEAWLKNFSPTNAYLLSSESAEIVLPLVSEKLCRKLKLPVTSAG